MQGGSPKHLYGHCNRIHGFGIVWEWKKNDSNKNRILGTVCE